MTDDINCDRLSASVLGKELERGECGALAGIMGVRHLQDGEVLVREGDEDSTLFVLVEGKLSVISGAQGQERAVHRMQPGEVAGTRAFVDRAPRRATLKAIGKATVYTLQPAEFESLLDSHPRVVYRVMRGLFCITHSNLMRMNVESKELSDYIHRSGRRY